MMLSHALQFSFFENPVETGDFLSRVKAYEGTLNSLHNGIPYFTNEFWTAKQRQSHSLHEISYRACFKAELPRFFIEKFTKEGDVVYDPFMGRGTTLLEAALLNRSVAGNDINPLSEMLIAPRLNPPSLRDIQKRLMQIPRLDMCEDDLLVFYHKDTLAELLSLKAWFQNRDLDMVDEWIRMVAINRLTGHSSGFFSVYSMPPNQAVSLTSQAKINEKRGQVPPYRNVFEIIMKKSKALLKDGVPKPSKPVLSIGQANANVSMKENCVDLIITSPPFLDIVNYKNDNWLRARFAGVDLERVAISHHKTIEAWESFIRSCFVDFLRALKTGGHICFEVGEVRKGTIRLEEHVLKAVAGLPYDVLGVVINAQNFTKTANCWGVDNNEGGTNTNRIVVLRKK